MKRDVFSLTSLSSILATLACLAACVGVLPTRADDALVRQGEFGFEPAAGELGIPERFQLPAAKVAYRQQEATDIGNWVDYSLVTFPSPVQTPHEQNNTVHCEYFRPVGQEKAPGVIVLHILGGDFPLSRLVCTALARRGVAALFVKMPYYGPRRDPDSPRRMISPDPQETVEGMTQAVLDIRLASAWLASRDEVDADKLGICGISLGGITGALAASVEPRLKNVCLLLAGGDVGSLAWDTPQLRNVRRGWESRGGTKDEFIELLKSVDPVTYATKIEGRRVLMINAIDDEVIPRTCTESLWNSLGKPDIVWYTGGHYTIAKHIVSIMSRTTRFFSAE